MKKLYLLLIAVLLLSVLTLPLFAGGQGEKKAAGKTKMAAIFPGSIQDADYNTLGYMALQEVGNKFDLDVAYSEKVAVPDAERAIREYINAGYKIIWVHGAQFNSAANKVGDSYPNVTFIIEGDSKPANPKPNFWYLDRNYYTGFYVLGALATLKTKSGKIGYIGGLEIPFTHGEINAIRQAAREVGKKAGKKVTLEYLYVGDFNDPLKTRQAAEGLISKGVDVIISAVNLGNFGLYNAVKEASKPVYITTTYTSKKVQAPKNYLTSDLFNFTIPLTEVLKKRLAGQKSGYVLLEYGKGKARYAEFPISNVSDDIQAKVKQIAEDVASGKIKVVKNLKEILP